MKNEFKILMFSLLLAVGWTVSAQAQQLEESPLTALTKLKSTVDKNTSTMFSDADLKTPLLNGRSMRAPRRADFNQTASATHVYSWYDAISYDWVDANGAPQNSKITEPATTAEQMAYLLGTTYMNPAIPGIKYSEVWQEDHPYYNIDFGWDIPINDRWNPNAASGTTYSDLLIFLPSYNMTIRSITVYNQNNTVLTSWNANTAWSNGQYGTYTNNNQTFYAYTLPGWNYSNYFTMWGSSGNRYAYMPGNGTIGIPATYLDGNTSIRVVIEAYSDLDGEILTVNGEGKAMTTTLDTYTWNFTGTSAAATVTPPYENGYTVFLVKVKDYNLDNRAPEITSSWDDVINYFSNYIDEIDLLTDGMRVNEGHDDAGTVFTYSGTLNKFYFISKGKLAHMSSSQSASNYDLAPSYGMYEEFSPTSTDAGAQVTDFYSKLLYGNSYNIIHDCQGVNYLQHFFSMSGNSGTDPRSLTNLIFYIPDSRGLYQSRNYDEEYLPHVGLYTITLEATAVPSTTQPGYYDVTCDWVSSLNSILDFPVEQDYELWIYVYDEQGNPVEERLVTTTHDVTTYTYPEMQYDESYTIIYRVKGWPTAATNNPVRGGNFFALSNLDPVLIPGTDDFLSLGVDHYESDFALDVEHNYYRNFLTVGNQNPDNALTAKRIRDGENQYELLRYDATQENPVMAKAADLVFSINNNKVEYDIVYDNQFYVDEANLIHVDDNGQSHQITGYSNPNALDCPTHGEIAKISEGGGTPPEPLVQYVRINSLSNLTSGEEYLIVCENNNVAFNGGLNTLDATGNTITVNPNNGIIPANNTTDAATFTITASGSGYTIKSKSGYYIRHNGGLFSSSALDVSTTTAYENSISFSGNNVNISYTYSPLLGSYTKYLQYSSGDRRFRYYNESAQQRIQLYKRVTDENAGYNLLNNFLDNSTYTQVGQVVFSLPWKSIQVKLQDESAGTSSGYFLIQSDGKLRFIMPAGYNNANLKFIIHNAPVSSNYYDGTFTLTSSTGETKNINIPRGGSTYGDRDYEVIFTGISSGDVITITGTHTVGNTLYNYSPDFKYIHVYVEGGHDGIGENQALNLDAVKFVDQFKAETKYDEHPYRYGYVLKLVGGTDESGRPEIPVQHTNSYLDGFYTLAEIQGDTKAPLLDMNVMNAEVNMTLSREPEIYFLTLDRKPSTVANAQWEAVSKLQRREDDSYQEMFNNLPQYNDQICNPPAITTPATPWLVERYDNFDVKQGDYNDFMNYVPVIWTHGDQKNRRIKWDTEKKHNSYGAPIWKTGVAEVTLKSAIAERQDNASTKWTYGGEECSLYMLDNIEAVAKMPTVNNVNYVPYMFRIFVKSKNQKLRGYTLIAADEDPNLPGEHYVGAAIDCDTLQCVWSGYVNDPKNNQYGVMISENEVNGAKVYTFHKNKVDRTDASGEWDKDVENAIFASVEDLIQGEGENMSIDGDDLTIVVRFYYLVEGFDASAPSMMRGGDDAPAGYGAEGQGFTPGPSTAVNELGFSRVIESVTYVNAQGMQSDRPFDGINIVITRYTDGTVRTSKVVR